MQANRKRDSREVAGWWRGLCPLQEEDCAEAPLGQGVIGTFLWRHMEGSNHEEF